jgi:hypothetical protein
MKLVNQQEPLGGMCSRMLDLQMDVFFYLFVNWVHAFINTKHDEMCYVMVFNATFNNISVISWQSVLWVEKNRVPGENHRLVASH